MAVLASLVLAALGLAGLMLAGLGPWSAREAAAGSAAEHAIDPGTGEVLMTIPHKDGIATLRSGPKVPVTLPKGMSLFPGSRVVSNSQIARPGGGQDMLVTFETEADAAAVIAHTRDEAKRAGFAVTLDVQAGDTLIVVGERKGAKLTATATRGTPTTGQISIAAMAPG